MLLVNSRWLIDKYSDKGWKDSIVLLDGSWYLPNLKRDPFKEYTELSIPFARFFNIDTVCDQKSNLPHTIPNTNQFEASVKKLGIKNSDHIVIYSKDGIGTSPRVWWLFKIFGHKKISILNGGIKSWIDEGGEISKGKIEKFTNINYKANYNSAHFCNLSDIQEVTKKHECQIIDARSKGRFDGILPEPRKNIRSGHIPGSQNLPYQNLIDNNGYLLDSKKLKILLSKKNININEPIISTCGSGVSACVLAFALESIGKQNWKIYDGSWTEWVTMEDKNKIK